MRGLERDHRGPFAGDRPPRRSHGGHPRASRRAEGLLLTAVAGEDKGMTVSPVNLNQALASFPDIYSPRIVGRVNDYDIKIAHARGEHVWHVHEHTDEFFLV